MSSVIRYEVNQLGVGRWQRAVLEGGLAAAQPILRQHRPRIGWRRGIAVVGLALALVVGLLVFSSQSSYAGLSSYAGVGGSYPLVAGLSEAGPLALTNAPTLIEAQIPLAPTLAAPAASLDQRKVMPGDYNLLGKPSISVATIEQVLKQYNSPAVGNGQAFYDLGVKYGVDPAFMLAFYVHESAAGTVGAAVATRSVGNIICAGWAGSCIGRFRAYNSYVQAAEDWYQLITGPLYIGAGLTTPDLITPRYAPSSDNNDPNGYAKTVERLVDQWRAQRS